MATVTYLPASTTVNGDFQDSLLDIALDNDIDIDHNCGGNCACTTCCVYVEEGALLLSEMETEEKETLEENEKLLPNLRLACQSRIIGDGKVVVTLHG
jgi:ferredoxin, 2Fe-2S